MYRRESAAPSGFGEEMDDQVECLGDAVAQRITLILITRGLKRPVDQQRTAADKFARRESPKPAIPTLLPVVTHHKVSAGRHHELAVLHIILDAAAPSQGRARQILARGRGEIV